MRKDFHDDIDRLLDQLVATAQLCDTMLLDAVALLATPAARGADEVALRDNDVDRAYQQIQDSILGLFALQAPVASDLRLLAAMLHANIHVERLGDYATNVARTAKRVAGLGGDAEVTDALAAMGQAAVEVSRAALRSLVERDEELARRLPELDDAVDAQYLATFRKLVDLAATDEEHMNWATNMIVVARSLERYGDHGVDIGEQTIYAVSGSFAELSSNEPLDGI